MITLQDLFSILTTGPYANTTFSGTNNVLKEEHYGKVVNLVNLGVLELYKRFKFLENELVLHITPLTRNYYLRLDRVTSIESISDVQYIEIPSDTNGFLNVVKITGAYDASGEELRINNPTRSTNYLLPQITEISHDVIQITNILAVQTINIMYQAYPNKITADDYADPENCELNISDVVVDPLVSYIAAKTFKPMGANDSTANADKSGSYEQAYELACQKLQMYGLYNSDHTERNTFNNEFNRSGWV
jgi:hypothetical protein